MRRAVERKRQLRGLSASELRRNGRQTKSVALVFGDFEVEQRADGSDWELGRGGMGVTYLARDKVLRRRVALKVIDAPTVSTDRDSQTTRERFLREARPAAALRHPNVAAVYQFGAAPDGSRCLRNGIGRGRNVRDSCAKTRSAESKASCGNCDSNRARADRCRGSRFDPS